MTRACMRSSGQRFESHECHMVHHIFHHPGSRCPAPYSRARARDREQACQGQRCIRVAYRGGLTRNVLSVVRLTRDMVAPSCFTPDVLISCM